MTRYMIRRKFYLPKDEVSRNYRYEGAPRQVWMYGFVEEFEEE